MKNICFYILQLLYGERVGFGQNTLGAVILILSVYILEIYSVTARNNFYFNSLARISSTALNSVGASAVTSL